VIRVVASRILEEPDVSGPFVLRTGDADTGAMLTLDEYLKTPDEHTINAAVELLVHLSHEKDFTYVATGTGVPGDAIVAGLPSDVISEIHAAPPRRGGFGLGSCQVIDALELAVAEARQPFSSGLAPFDATVPLVVTNWYGDGVINLAASRLQRIYGHAIEPGPTDDFELLLAGVESTSESGTMATLEQLTARLRRPDGCPWDREQTRESLFPQFQEELAELGTAIQNNDIDNVCEELGDVLFHIVIQCQLAVEAGQFALEDVIREINSKLVRRHPHVFGDVLVESMDDVLMTWQRVKSEEKRAAR
jgi:NTP pyrophosphatase (non-canonical NTP hydrolase)